MKPQYLLAISLLSAWGTAVFAATPMQSQPVAAPPTEPFAAIPLSDPAYKFVKALLKAGIAVLPPDRKNKSGQGGATRYEFAVAVAHLSRLLSPPSQNKSLSDGLRQELVAKLRQSDTATSLLSLINEFQPELLRLGQDVAAERHWLWEYFPFSDLPENDPIYPQFNRVEQVVYGSVNYIPIPSKRRLSAYEFAAFLGRSAYLLEQPGTRFASATLSELRPDASTTQSEIDAQRQQVQQRLRDTTEGRLAFAALVTEFAPILRKLKVNVPAFKARLKAFGSAQTSAPGQMSPFPDVPTDHWAYQSVETVRKAGILVGYPKGEFRKD